MPDGPTYPEHDKLALFADKSQACGEFYDWLTGERGLTICEGHQHSPECAEGCIDRRFYPARVNITDLLAEFFEIDQTHLEAEKRAMLDAIRRANRLGIEGVRHQR